MADLHSKILNPPISVQCFFIFIQFYGKFGQIIGLRVRLPLWGCPPPRLRTGPRNGTTPRPGTDREREGRQNPSVADPGFPEGVRQLPKSYYFADILPKTAWKWKNLDPRGRASLVPPFNLPMPFPHCWSRSRSRPLAVWTSYKAWNQLTLRLGICVSNVNLQNHRCVSTELRVL